jgi:xanthine dehydrogenase accessory factor
VKAGASVAFVKTSTEGNELPVTAAIDGVLRGILRDGLQVKAGMKVGDVDPRAAREHCFTISDKSRAIAGGALEAIIYLLNRKYVVYAQDCSLS